MGGGGVGKWGSVERKNIKIKLNYKLWEERTLVVLIETLYVRLYIVFIAECKTRAYTFHEETYLCSRYMRENILTLFILDI